MACSWHILDNEDTSWTLTKLWFTVVLDGFIVFTAVAAFNVFYPGLLLSDFDWSSTSVSSNRNIPGLPWVCRSGLESIYRNFWINVPRVIVPLTIYHDKSIVVSMGRPNLRMRDIKTSCNASIAEFLMYNSLQTCNLGYMVKRNKSQRIARCHSSSSRLV